MVNELISVINVEDELKTSELINEATETEINERIS